MSDKKSWHRYYGSDKAPESPESLGLVWTGNNIALVGNPHPRVPEGCILAEPQKPTSSPHSDEEFAKIVKEKDLRGIYGPAPAPK